MRQSALSIRPIQEALALFYERQISWADAALQQQSVERRLAKLAPVNPCEELCAALGRPKGKGPAQSVEIKFEPLLGDQLGTKEKADRLCIRQGIFIQETPAGIQGV